MSKRKRERMKQKAARHAVSERAKDIVSHQPPFHPSKMTEIKHLTQQSHLTSASLEWKDWYAAVSKAIGKY